jgi:transcriptional regulator with XRE-family HTH domain
VLPTPEEGLASLGAFIRAARLGRGITQARAAREARVSRKQLALLEQGGNVSVKFLLRLARYLELDALPLDGTVRMVAGESGLDVVELLRYLHFLSALVEQMRDLAIHAALPPSQRGTLDDTLALRDFVARQLGDETGTRRLAAAVFQLSDEVPPALKPRADALKKTQRRTAGRVKKA